MPQGRIAGYIRDYDPGLRYVLDRPLRMALRASRSRFRQPLPPGERGIKVVASQIHVPAEVQSC